MNSPCGRRFSLLIPDSPESVFAGCSVRVVEINSKRDAQTIVPGTNRRIKVFFNIMRDLEYRTKVFSKCYRKCEIFFNSGQPGKICDQPGHPHPVEPVSYFCRHNSFV